MPDTKITALAAITTVAPSNDLFPIVDVSDNSMAASGTTKNITVNQLLGAGGIAALSSATITGDLTVDTNTLKVDSVLNRVGIGTASPSQPLDIIGGFKSSGFWILDGTPFGAGGSVRYISGANTSNSFYQNCPTGGSHLWAFNESLAMTLNSTGLLVGTNNTSYGAAGRGVVMAGGSTSALFGIRVGSTDIGYLFGDATKIEIGYPAAGTVSWNNGAPRMTLDATGNLGIGVVSPSSKFHVDAGSSSEYFRGAGNSGAARALVISASTTTNAGDTHTLNAGSVSGVLAFSTNAIERMRLDASGNLGIGVTPSAWPGQAANYHVLQAGLSSFVNVANVATEISYNQYVDSGGTRRYIASNTAMRHRMGNTDFQWHIAPSGTAGTAITFTQAMTLDASGRLLVGTSVLNASWDTRLTLSSDIGTTRWAVGPYAAPQNFVISAGAGTGVYLNGTAATSWTSLSDERFKDIIEPIINAVSKVASLRAVIGKFKFDENNTRKPFLIAQDIQAVLPEAVDASNTEQLGLAYTDVIPLLVAAIKELTARVQTLETR